MQRNRHRGSCRPDQDDRFTLDNMSASSTSTTKNKASNNNNNNNNGSFSELYTRPTESDSFDEPDDSLSTSSDFDSEGLGLQIPSGYRSKSSSSLSNKNMMSSPLSRGMSTSSLPMKMTGIKDEDRLLMLAKHPNATEQQVVQTLVRQQQKAARQKHMHPHAQWNYNWGVDNPWKEWKKKVVVLFLCCQAD